MTFVYYPIRNEQALAAETEGEWFAAAHDSSVLLVEVKGEATEKSTRLELLWKSLAEANGVQATLDELTRRGLSATEQFALVNWQGSSEAQIVKAIVRGNITLTVHEGAGSSSIDGAGVSTWHERQFSGVRTFELRAGLTGEIAEPSDPSSAVALIPFHSGVVKASRLTVDIASATSVSAPLPAAQAIDPEVTVAATARVSESAPESAVAAVVAEPAAAAPAPAAPAPAEPVEVGSEPAPATASGSSDNAEESAYDYLFGETVFRTVQDAAVHDQADENSSVDSRVDSGVTQSASLSESQDDVDDDGDHDGHTIVSADIAQLRASRRGRSREPRVTASEPTTPTLYLEMPNGSRELLTQPLLVGRSPSVSKVSAGQLPRLVTVDGPDQDISRNHAQFVVEGGTVVVTDLHSRNGTTVVLPGRAPQLLRQGEPTSVIVGTVIDLGGGVTFTVGEE